jgi:hypothetical protein
MEKVALNEHMQFILWTLGVTGSTSWALLQFVLRQMNEKHEETRRWMQERFDHYEQQRKTGSEAWKEMIRTMQAFDNRIDSRLDNVEHWLGRLEDCYCKDVNDPPSGYP